MAGKKHYGSVSAMVRENSGDKEFADELQERISKRGIVKHLMSMRSARGMSQADLANAMGCGQSRISKLESGLDEHLRVGDIEAYLDALGYEARLILAKKGRGLAEEIKSNWRQLAEHLDQLRKIASGDPAIEKGIGDFSRDVTLNFFALIARFIEKLPDAAKKQAPVFKIMRIVDEDEPASEPVPIRPSRREKKKQTIRG